MRRRLPAAAAAAADADADAAAPQDSWKQPAGWQVLVNKATKYAVTLATFVSVVSWPDRLLACWVLVGAVTNAFVNKALKYMLNHARPASALHAKTDPGMPSSHAQSLAYLAGYPAMGWLAHASPVQGTALALTGLALASLRVRCGLHTWPQVLVGLVAGAGTAAAWRAVAAAAMPQVRDSAAASAALVGAALLLAAAFVQLVIRPAQLYSKLIHRLRSSSPPPTASASA